MSGESGEGDRLLEGIAEEAQQEAKKIKDEAEQQAAEIVNGAKKRAEKILEEAEQRGEEQARIIRSKNGQNIDAERRRLRLKTEERLFDRALELIHERLAQLRDSGEYPDILRSWIAEGALGLGVEEAEVNAPAQERELITEELLGEAEEELRSLGGETKLRLSDKAPISGQGVVVEESGGRLAYRNTVEARLQRYNAEVRRMIYEEIQEEPK
jgi:F-type H+-transporting ATPase subunit b